MPPTFGCPYSGAWLPGWWRVGWVPTPAAILDHFLLEIAMAERFVGRRLRDRCEVIVEAPGEVPMPLPHMGLHSPTGFEWGYLGSGPADLARSMCAAVLGSMPSARVCDFVKVELVSGLDTDEWEIPWSRVLDSISRAAGQAGTFTPEVFDGD